ILNLNVVDWSKGGKGGKGVSGKGSVPKEPPKYDLNVEQELPKNAECLMDCEAADILQGVQEQMIMLSRDPTIKLPPNLKNQGVRDGEICMIANTGPESIEELYALLPTLKAKGSKVNNALKEALGKLEELKCPTEGFN
ncbi:hypothetical protein V2J09_003325, partial [Rumex salicifolius]